MHISVNCITFALVKLKQLYNMATNRKIYQVEVRQFFKSNSGVDYLNACSPFILITCSSKKKALDNYNRTIMALNLDKCDVRDISQDVYNNILCGIAQQNYVDEMRYVVLIKQYQVI